MTLGARSDELVDEVADAAREYRSLEFHGVKLVDATVNGNSIGIQVHVVRLLKFEEFCRFQRLSTRLLVPVGIKVEKIQRYTITTEETATVKLKQLISILASA